MGISRPLGQRPKKLRLDLCVALHMGLFTLKKKYTIDSKLHESRNPFITSSAMPGEKPETQQLLNKILLE